MVKTYELDRGIELTPGSEAGEFHGVIGTGWLLGQTPYGGYPMTMVIRAATMAAATKIDAPLQPASANLSFLRRLAAGPCRLRTSMLHVTKRMAFVQVLMLQGDVEAINATVVVAAPESQSGPSAPKLPPLAAASRFEKYQEVRGIAFQMPKYLLFFQMTQWKNDNLMIHQRFALQRLPAVPNDVC